MAKFTQSQRRQLESIRDNLNRALAYLDQPRIMLTEKVEWTNGLDYVARSDAAQALAVEEAHKSGVHSGERVKVQGLSPRAKDIGSDIAGFGIARYTVNQLLEADDRARGVRTEEV